MNTMTIDEFKKLDEDDYEVYDEETGTWKLYSESCYIKTGPTYPNMDTADKEITSISMKSSKSNTYNLLGRKDYDKTKTISGIDPDDIQFMKFDTEEAMLRRFVQIWTNEYPDAVTGWNVEYFDIQYIVTRIIRLLGEKVANTLSPWGIIRMVTKKIFHRDQSTYEITGITVIDYMDTFKKFGYKYGPQASYKLDNIAQVVLGTKKIDYSEYGTLTDLYEKNPQLYLDYSLVDTQLIQQMEDVSGLISLIFTVAYSSGVNYNETFGTVGIWETIIYRVLADKGLVPPLKRGPGEQATLLGGHVKAPIPGMYRWVATGDLASLYPHLIMQYNMSPETYLPNMTEYISQEMVLEGKYQSTHTNISVAPNGACFTNEVLGILPEFIQTEYNTRKVFRKQELAVEQQLETVTDTVERKRLKQEETQLHNMQMAIKIKMNSLYGALGNRYFLYYINDIAEAITTAGQVSIKTAENVINNYLNDVMKTEAVEYVLYADTDSIFINLEPLIIKVFGTTDIPLKEAEEFMDRVCHDKLEVEIEKGYEALAKQLTTYRNAMFMKREKLANKLLITGKKRYIASVMNNEGVHYTVPKIGVTGIESVRSSTPEVCRGKMNESFDVIMTGDESGIQEFIEDFRKEFIELPASAVAKITGTNDLEKYMDSSTLYKKGTPIHVRASILYNNFLKEKGLEKKYEKIQSGDKVKFLYLKTPNPLRENTIAFIDELPPEFGLDQYIDHEQQFDAVFLTPIKNILDAIDWSPTKLDTLESFFG